MTWVGWAVVVHVACAADIAAAHAQWADTEEVERG